jgi:ATP-dependent DNA ligase
MLRGGAHNVAVSHQVASFIAIAAAYRRAALMRAAGKGTRQATGRPRHPVQRTHGRRRPTVFAHACKMELEGIVSKRKDSMYRSGRSPDWLKMKNPACAAVTREAEKKSFIFEI